MKNENTKKQARELPSASSEELEAELLKRKLSENIFPLDVFPSEISGFVDVLVNKKLDRGYIGTAILTAFASVIGNRFVSTTPDGFAVKSILWSAIVGISSGGKSITQNLVYKALNELQSKLESQYTDDAPKKRLVVGKGTHEALFKEIIPDNPQGILRFEDELRGWLEGIGQYSRNRGAEETDFISLFDGSKVEVNRSQRKTFIIEKPYMSLTGSTQNYFLKRFLEEGLTKSGLTNRFLFVLPNYDGIHRSNRTKLSDEIRKGFDEALFKIYAMQKTEYELFYEDEDAVWQVFEHFEDYYIRKTENDCFNEDFGGIDREVFAGFFGKMRIYFWRFSLILTVMNHIFKNPDNPRMWYISEQEAKSSHRLCDYYLKNISLAYRLNNQRASVPPEVLRLSALVKQGYSVRGIADLLSEDGKKVSHSTVSRQIQKYSVEYPNLFGGKK